MKKKILSNKNTNSKERADKYTSNKYAMMQSYFQACSMYKTYENKWDCWCMFMLSTQPQ